MPEGSWPWRAAVRLRPLSRRCSGKLRGLRRRRCALRPLRGGRRRGCKSGGPGGGPADVYLFAKALAEAAASEGIPRDLALRMALKTIEGAEYNMRVSRLAPEELIRIVASPGGTTEAALRRFAADGFSDIVAGAVHAAADRSRELGRSY